MASFVTQRASHRIVNTSTLLLSTISKQQLSSMASNARVAVLHQAIESPVINEVQKPMKPGDLDEGQSLASDACTDQIEGYQDSGADIAYILSNQRKISIAFPVLGANLDSREHDGWTFPDFEESLVSAVEKHGASHFWSNTIVFTGHPLQTSAALDRHARDLRVVGQAMRHVQQYDDKNYVNTLLRKARSFTMPKSFVAPNSHNIESLLREHDLNLPVVAKPIRGRGSQGVKLGPGNAMLEEFLQGTEGTVTVMPPSPGRPDHWSMPVVVRFNHNDGIAPYNGIVAVTANSRAVPEHEAAKDPAYARVQRECEAVARLLQVKAPIRIDVKES